jgi:glutaredoxin
MKIIHFILGRIILFIDFLTSPKGIQRSPEEQAKVEQETQSLTLYQYKACPFCVKVRRSMKRLSLPIDLRDPKRSIDATQELIAGAGKLKVPCLKIMNDEDKAQWMFESKDIIQYLEGRFSGS